MKAALYDNHINLEGFRYFVGHASDVLFGAYGQKKNSLIPGNPPYLDVFDVIPAPKLTAMKLVTTALEVEFADAKSINLLAGLKIPGLASGQVGVKVSDINGGRVKLLKVSPGRRKRADQTDQRLAQDHRQADRVRWQGTGRRIRVGRSRGQTLQPLLCQWQEQWCGHGRRLARQGRARGELGKIQRHSSPGHGHRLQPRRAAVGRTPGQEQDQGRRPAG